MILFLSQSRGCSGTWESQLNDQSCKEGKILAAFFIVMTINRGERQDCPLY